MSGYHIKKVVFKCPEYKMSEITFYYMSLHHVNYVWPSTLSYHDNTLW